MRNFDEDVKINKYKLPDECQKQSSNYYYWAKKLARKKTLYNKQKNKIDLISAQKEIALRNNWNENKWGKLTEGGIKAVLKTDKKIKEETDLLIDIQEEINILESAVNALEHKKRELDNLVTLLVKGFYSDPDGNAYKFFNDETQVEERNHLNKKGKR